MVIHVKNRGIFSPGIKKKKSTDLLNWRKVHLFFSFSVCFHEAFVEDLVIWPVYCCLYTFRKCKMCSSLTRFRWTLVTCPSWPTTWRARDPTRVSTVWPCPPIPLRCRRSPLKHPWTFSSAHAWTHGQTNYDRHQRELWQGRLCRVERGVLKLCNLCRSERLKCWQRSFCDWAERLCSELQTVVWLNSKELTARMGLSKEKFEKHCSLICCLCYHMSNVHWSVRITSISHVLIFNLFSICIYSRIHIWMSMNLLLLLMC